MKRGFAGMNKAKQHEIASKGGQESGGKSRTRKNKRRKPATEAPSIATFTVT